MMRAILAVSSVAVIVMVAAAVASCAGNGEIVPVGCDYPDDYHYAADGRYDPCHCLDDAGSVGVRGKHECDWAIADADAGDAEVPLARCRGRCLPLGPLEWSGPAYLWFGPELEAPACPPVAPVQGYEGHADLHAPATCAACVCEAPTGSCALPETLTASSLACPGTGPLAALTPFNPPADWDGSCSTDEAVPANSLCNGRPCVRSLRIAPLALIESGCSPVQAPVPFNATAGWMTYGRACIGSASGACGAGETCAPGIAPNQDGFMACIFHEGDVPCTSEAYTDKHVLYSGFVDTRSCTQCSCGAPVGGKCTATISIYSDDLCSMPISSTLMDSTTPICTDLIPGSALGSKSADEPTYTPGVCQPSGGEPMGSAEPIVPATFCCLTN